MGTLRIKSSIELKSQIQDFLAVSPYAEQLQGLLALSEEELQNPNAVQKFLEQQHLDSQIWTEYIDKLKVRKFLEKKPYFLYPSRFPEHADFARKVLLAQELRVLKLLEKE